MDNISNNKNKKISSIKNTTGNQKPKIKSVVKNTVEKKPIDLLSVEKKIFESARTIRAKNIAFASGDNLSPKDRDALINEAQPYILLTLANRKDLSPEHIDALIKKGDNRVLNALEKSHTLKPEQKETIRIRGRIEI